MASSSSAMNSREYDVFLSFRGADTRNCFTSHLYNALCKEGVNAFMDKRLQRGEEISSTLFQVIEASKISIIVFSENYASSEFCLDELLKILECKASRGQVVLPVFYKVNPLEVEKRTGSYGEALCKFEAELNGCKRLKTCSNGEDSIKGKMKKVGLWGKALEEAADLAGWDLHNRDEAEIIQDIVKFVLQKLNHGQLERVQVEGVSAPHQSREVFPEKRLVGKNLENSVEQIWSWLTDDDVSSIGIWGMGGVGKTTLLIHIRNLLLDKGKVFGQIYWVTVSQDFSVQNLQNLIAAEILLEFGSEKGLLKRAARLSTAIKAKGNFVLILDDLWDHFDMNKVGIPIESNGCKLIVTTRSHSVCTRIGLQKLKKVEALSEEDAWNLFKETLGHDLGKNVEPTAKNVAKECGGLPLGIVTMAGSMRGVDDIHEWNNALAELKRSEIRPDDMEVEVFPILKFSYTRLNDWILQQCFLFCALFPEDHKIRREELIDFFIAEGIMKRQASREMDLDKGHAMLNKLVKVSLLEEEGREDIKMHDLIRDMAIQIMKESCPSIIEAGRQLRQVPEEKYWTEGIVWVSLVKNDISKIPSNYSPKCSTLSTLLLSQNQKLRSISDSFLNHFSGLKVLDLSKTCIQKLPESVGCLGNLKALSVRWCLELRILPSLGKLSSLEMLDLSNCMKLSKVPEGLELLSNLTFLNLCGSGIYRLPAGVLTRLSHLQLLAFCCNCLLDRTIPEVQPAELVALQKLVYLSWRFHDFREFDEYVQSVSKMQGRWQIMEYFIFVGMGYIGNIALTRFSRRELRFHGCEIGAELFIPKNLQMLVIEDVTICNGSGLRLETHSYEPELRHLDVRNCGGIRYLFHLSSSSPSILGTVEHLVLAALPELQTLFGKEMEETAPPTEGLLRCATTFCSLRKILLSGCNKMKSLFSPRLFSSLLNLEEIGITLCSEMEMIVATTEDEASCAYNRLHLTETSLFSLSKLKELSLIRLPKLKRKCNEQIVCDSLRKLMVLECNELENIPISLPLLSLQDLRVSPTHWWKSVKWGSPGQKSALRPKFHNEASQLDIIRENKHSLLKFSDFCAANHP